MLNSFLKGILFSCFWWIFFALFNFTFCCCCVNALNTWKCHFFLNNTNRIKDIAWFWALSSCNISNGEVECIMQLEINYYAYVIKYN